ncbi:TPA: hypothetical protein NOE00_002096 [Pseudomonas aeruginosa]|nr:hypothetical protein [Pseudomonas aeruginosa]
MKILQGTHPSHWNRKLTVSLPLVNTFAIPYEKWETRRPTLEEALANGSPDAIRIGLKARVSSAHDAAVYMATVGADNGLGNHIEAALNASYEYKAWRDAMPSSTPPEIARYQKAYQKSDFAAVSSEIAAVGSLLSPGQCLFHGGLWTGWSTLVVSRPLSTSLCPQVAMRNAEHSSKAYNAGRIDLLLLRVVNPRTKAFVFRRKGTNLGHESEVLFAAGAELAVKSRSLISENHPVEKCGFPKKAIPVYVLEVEVS